MEKKAMTVESAKQAVAEKYRKPSWVQLMSYGWHLHTIDEEESEKERILDEVHEMVDDELARLAAELEKHRWIPVEEMLPEVDTLIQYIVKSPHAKHLRVKAGFLKNCKLTNGEEYKQFTMPPRHGYFIKQVTHWRYLPELP